MIVSDGFERSRGADGSTTESDAEVVPKRKSWRRGVDLTAEQHASPHVPSSFKVETIGKQFSNATYT